MQLGAGTGACTPDQWICALHCCFQLDAKAAVDVVSGGHTAEAAAMCAVDNGSTCMPLLPVQQSTMDVRCVVLRCHLLLGEAAPMGVAPAGLLTGT
jgi:hypothetical protein